MEKFLRRLNLANYCRQLAETKDEAKRQVLLKLLAEEEAKDLPSSPENERAADEGIGELPLIAHRPERSPQKSE